MLKGSKGLHRLPDLLIVSYVIANSQRISFRAESLEGGAVAYVSEARVKKSIWELRVLYYVPS